jgi:anti-sigma regulatory factor (Ser/Thr protein kinase)
MVDVTHTRYTAEDRSYFALIKRDIHKKAIDAGFEQKRTYDIDLIVAEMTSNLSKYAKGGELLIGYFDADNEGYLEIISMDKGPGIRNITRMLEDGVSSRTDSMGHGLGSMKRLSDFFQIYTLPDWGTIVVSRVYKKKPSTKVRKLDIKPLVLAKPGEEVSGDGFAIRKTEEYLKIFVGDGLGHGKDANIAVNHAIELFKAYPEESPVATLRYLHGHCNRTRGLVATIAVFNIKTQVWLIAGVGNVSAKFLSQLGAKSHIPYNGIVGHNIPRTMNDTIVEGGFYNKLVFCSDGIKSRWEQHKYPLIEKYDPVVFSAAIYKDFGRMTDDMSVVTVKIKI